MKARRGVWPGLALATALLMALALPSRSAAGEPVTADALWSATLTDLDERPVALATYRGRPLVVNFWARWCGPCKAEIPDFARTYTRFLGRGQGPELLGIAIEDKTASVRDFARAYEMNYPVLLAKAQGLDLMRALGNSKAVLPFTLVIDRRGQVVLHRLGALSAEQIDAAFGLALR